MTDLLHSINQIVQSAAGDPGTTAPASTLFEITDKSFAFLGAGVAMLAALGTAIGQGVATANACSGVARNPEAVSAIRTMLIIGCAISESSSIYGLLISFLLIFVAK